MSDLPQHSTAFRRRRFLNWFPLGLTYAFLYMGRYNLTVSKTALGGLMTKEDFGDIFATGTLVYGFSFLLNGPLVDRLGGRKGILAAALGAGLSNLALGTYIHALVTSADPTTGHLRLWMSVLYALNMYFQSFGAVSIVKVNSSWFHVRERGGFSGIFGTMISSGIFFAFTVNGWLLDLALSRGGGLGAVRWVFYAPALLLLGMFVFEYFVLRDRPSGAGFEDFDTGDASSGESDEPIPTLQLLKRILTNPIILTVAGIEFCTGVLRNGVMHWFPFYIKEVWALPNHHPLMYGDWGAHWQLWVALFAVGGAVMIYAALKLEGRARGIAMSLSGLALLAPFFFAGGWGGMLFAAGVLGANVAGWVSDLFFQSRRAPTALMLYALVGLGVVGMFFSLGGTTTRVAWVDPEKGAPLQVGDELLEVAGQEVHDWTDVSHAVACIPAACERSTWDAANCTCSTRPEEPVEHPQVSTGTIPVKLRRDGKVIELELPDPKPSMRAGDHRKLAAGPELTINPWYLGAIVFFISLGVIGTHGLLSGTATMDFGGRKGAATAVGVIDGAVYLGTALEGVSLGHLTSMSWSYWPVFLLPFSLVGMFLLSRIWNAVPRGARGH